MTRRNRLLLTICLLAVAGLVLLQFFWIRHYYRVSLFNFEREINLAFEDAVKKEFESRCDTIELLLTEQLMDTSLFVIRSRYNLSTKKIQHNIYNARNLADYTSFSHAFLPDSLTVADTAYRRKIASHYAHQLRSEDLENHIVYYRTQNLGQFLTSQVEKYAFDTTRLRPFLEKYLAKRKINTSFSFYLAAKDSLLNEVTIPDSLSGKGPFFTKSYPTYKWQKEEEQYVRAVFKNPIGYVLRQMKWILAGSLLLIVFVAVAIGLLIRALFHEKKLRKIKNDFINNITHELKTPVATVSAAIEALQEYDLDTEKQQRYLGHARNEVGKLQVMIDDILEVSRQESRQVYLQPATVNIEATIQSVIDQIRMLSNRPIHYQYQSTAASPTVVADPTLFRRAVMNVLDNAVKYAGEEVNIAVTSYTDNHYFHIRIQDNGEGISASALPYVFEKFYREPKSHHAVKGYGIGLSYVQEIMFAHKGTVTIDSVKNKGTIVILSWPI